MSQFSAINRQKLTVGGGFSAEEINILESIPNGGYTTVGLSGLSRAELLDLQAKLNNIKPKYELFLQNIGLPFGYPTNDDEQVLFNVGVWLRDSLLEIATALSGTPLSGPIISVSNTLDFGSIEVGKTTSLSFTIKNDGNADLLINGYTINQIPEFFTVGPEWNDFNRNNPMVIKANSESKPLGVSFKPTTQKSYSTTISFFSNSPANSGNNSITIKGVGTPPADPGVDSVLGKKATGTTRIFFLKNLREGYRTTNNSPDINSPYFDARTTKHSVELIADLYQCYTKPGETTTTTSRVLDGVCIAEGIGSFWFEECDEFLGGLLPVYQYYYKESDLNEYRSWRKSGQSGVLEDQRKLRAFSDEMDAGTGFWGLFNPNDPDTIVCSQYQKAKTLYVGEVVANKLTKSTNVKIYDARNTQTQKRSVTTAPTRPDLLSPISGQPRTILQHGFISNEAFGRLSCLSPDTGCYVSSENPMTGPDSTRAVGEQIVRLAKNGRSAVPEQIPSDPCYRGYRTKYIRGYVHERKWEVMLNCLSGMFRVYEWRIEEALFEQNGQDFEVWEDVQFAGTEIGFNDVCIPDEVVKDQEPYVDASDIRGCYELHTAKIFHKYPDYSVPGMEDYIKGPQTLTTQDYSGLGPGIKLLRKVQRADCIDTPVRVFHPLIKGKDIMAASDILVTKGLFNHTQSLLSYSTSSKQSINSKKYYYDIVDETRIINGDPVVYFSVAYGNRYGSGSLYDGYEFNDSPSRAVYGQYRLLALDESETEFNVYTDGGRVTSRGDIYAISFNRDSLTDRIDPGNFEISLSGSGGIITLMDNSNDILEDKFSNQYVYTYFDIVSGSLTNGIQSTGFGNQTTNPFFTSYGRVYPNLGFIILDAEKLDDEIGLSTNLDNNVDGDNSYKIFTAISGAASEGYPLKVRSSKNKKTNHYFVRVGASTSNYTNNPTVMDESTDNNNYIKNNYFRYRPTTYITTVGLYNDMNELLAVAKLSKPILKTFDKDILIKIRLNW